MGKIRLITDNCFEKEVISEEIPVLVDFFTEGCGPCEAIKPILDELSLEYTGRLKILGFEVTLEELISNSNEIVKKYDVLGYPTLLILKNGQVEKSIIGCRTKDELIKEIEEVI